MNQEISEMNHISESLAPLGLLIKGNPVSQSDQELSSYRE